MDNICIVAGKQNSLFPLGLQTQLKASAAFGEIVLLGTDALNRVGAAGKLVIAWDRNVSESAVLDVLKQKRLEGYESPVLFIHFDHLSGNVLRGMLALGKAGVVGPDISLAELLLYFDELETGKRSWLLSPPLQETLLNSMLFGEETRDFTDREAAVIREAQQGNSIEETARKLGISRHTVVSHRRNIFKKTGVRSIHKIRLDTGRGSIIPLAGEEWH